MLLLTYNNWYFRRFRIKVSSTWLLWIMPFHPSSDVWSSAHNDPVTLAGGEHAYQMTLDLVRNLDPLTHWPPTAGRGSLLGLPRVTCPVPANGRAGSVYPGWATGRQVNSRKWGRSQRSKTTAAIYWALPAFLFDAPTGDGIEDMNGFLEQASAHAYFEFYWSGWCNFLPSFAAVCEI